MKKKLIFLLVALAVYEDVLAEHTSFVVVVPSYNNKRWCIKNILSILNQHYDHYRVLLIDDHSSDDQISAIKQAVALHPKGWRVRIIENEQRFGAMANHYYAAQLCQPWEVIIDVDGDDWLYDQEVLSYLHTVYHDPDVWLTYGSYTVASDRYIPSCSRALPDWVIRDHAYREYPFITTHMRTYYAGLFHAIKIKDLWFRGRFFPSSCDIGYMMPMIEMAHEHSRFIDKPLYVYNAYNPIMDYRVNKPLQDIIAWHVRMLKPYTRRSALPREDSHAGIEMVTINRRMWAHDFTSLACAIQNTLQDYVALVPADFQFPLCILEYCAHMLQRTQAKAFFLHVSFDAFAWLYKNRVVDNIYAWQSTDAGQHMREISSMPAVWPKKILLKALGQAQSCDAFYAALYAYLAHGQVCLSFSRPHMFTGA